MIKVYFEPVREVQRPRRAYREVYPGMKVKGVRHRLLGQFKEVELKEGEFPVWISNECVEYPLNEVSAPHLLNLERMFERCIREKSRDISKTVAQNWLHWCQYVKYLRESDLL